MTRSSFWKAVSLKLRAIRATCTQAGSPTCLDNNTKHIQEKNPRFLPRKKLSESIFYKTHGRVTHFSRLSPWRPSAVESRASEIKIAVGKMWVHIITSQSSSPRFQRVSIWIFQWIFHGFSNGNSRWPFWLDHLRALAHSCQLPVPNSGPVFRMNPLLPQIRFQMHALCFNIYPPVKKLSKIIIFSRF